VIDYTFPYLEGYMENINIEIIKKIDPFIRGMRAYHQHEVQGMESIPDQGKTLLVLTHSLATYDIAFLIHSILKEKSRLARPLVDRLFYKIPFGSEIIESIGGIQGTPNKAKELLNLGEIVAVAPGGMQEALKAPKEKYKIMWDKRKGFAKLAIESQAPVVIAVCPNADDMYDLIPNKFTDWAYEKLKIPLFLAKGIGYTPIPKPVSLTHLLSKPIKPPKMLQDPIAHKRQVTRFHKKLITIANDLIDSAVEFPDRKNEIYLKH
jgi:1-acyl-sn-glycerol-3-phosphate acyltransferase